jgi:hypothetical protein
MKHIFEIYFPKLKRGVTEFELTFGPGTYSLSNYKLVGVGDVKTFYLRLSCSELKNANISSMFVNGDGTVTQIQNYNSSYISPDNEIFVLERGGVVKFLLNIGVDLPENEGETPMLLLQVLKSS